MEKILQFHSMESIYADIVLRVAEFDVHSIWYCNDVAISSKPWNLRLLDEEFLTMLVTLDFGTRDTGAMSRKLLLLSTRR